jgi:hypothetical protein
MLMTPEARKRKDAHLKRTYGISIDDWEGLLASQGYKCGCGCGKDFQEGKRWSVDHDHETGEVRGIVQYACNRYFIGSFDVTGAYRLYRYLTDPPARRYFGGQRFVPKGMEKPKKRRKRRVTVKRNPRSKK